MVLNPSRNPLRSPDFAWFLTARSISWLGSAIVPVALAFAVLDLSGSAGGLALVIAGRTAAFCVFVLFGGVVSDRLPRRFVLQASHAIAAVTQGIAATLLLTGAATLSMIVVLEVLNGAVSAFTMPAMQGIVPQLVPKELLQRANSLIALSRNGLQILGPSLGGLLAVLTSPGWALAIDSATFVVAMLCLTKVPTPPGHTAARTSGSLLSDLRGGWREFVSRRWVWTLVLTFMFLNAVYGGAWNVLGPLVSSANAGRQGWGFMVSVFSLGTVLATLVMLRLRVRHTLVMGMLCISTIGILLLLMGVSAPYPLLLVACAAGGFGLGVFSVAWETALSQHIPQEALSRVSSYDTLCSFVAMPLGQLAIGFVAVAVAPGTVLAWCGALYTVVALASLLIRDVRRLTTLSV